MENNELIKISKNIEEAYQELDKTINQVGKLKDLISNLSIASQEIKKIYDAVLNNDKLLEFKRNNAEAAKEIQSSLEKIDKDVTNILEKRTIFIDMVESYKESFARFQSIAEDEKKTTEELLKKVASMAAKLENDQRKFNTQLNRYSKAGEYVESVAKYDGLMKKLDTNNRLLENLTKLLNQSNNDKQVKKETIKKD